MDGILNGKSVVITGGTKGIGRGIALAVAAEGARVLISGRDENAAADVLKEASRISSGAVKFMQADMAVVDDCRRLIDYAEKCYGRLDGLVNNAGIFPRATLQETSEKLFDSIFNVNIKGAFYCTGYAIDAMKKTGGGSIVHMGSMAAFESDISIAAYTCSKGALHSLNRHVAGAYAQQGIRSNWITVGWVASDGELDRMREAGGGMKELEDEALKWIPSGRLQTPEDNAAAVIFLLSDASTQINGTDIQITGGKYF